MDEFGLENLKRALVQEHLKDRLPGVRYAILERTFELLKSTEDNESRARLLRLHQEADKDGFEGTLEGKMQHYEGVLKSLHVHQSFDTPQGDHHDLFGQGN